jgi:hypothetical protein
METETEGAEAPKRVVRLERRIDRKVFVMQLAAVGCALFAAAGIANGMYQANPDGGWPTPIFAGIIAALALAGIWHVLIGSITHMVRVIMVVALFAGAVALTAITVGASAQAIATAVSGRAALSAELSANVDAYAKALAEAYAQATGWKGVADSANVIATGLAKQAETERGGGNGTGKGCGPRCSMMQDAAAAFEAGAARLHAMLDDAAAIRESGDKHMSDLRLAASRGDQNAFMAAAEAVNQTIAKLNALDPKPIIDTTGMVLVSNESLNLSGETQQFREKASAALADRHSVDAPVFTPLSLGEATRRQFFGSAMQGWILAAVIDLLPLLIFSFAFVISREVAMHQEVERHSLTAAGKNDRDRNRYADLQGGGNVVRLPTAAE